MIYRVGLTTSEKVSTVQFAVSPTLLCIAQLPYGNKERARQEKERDGNFNVLIRVVYVRKAPSSAPKSMKGEVKENDPARQDS